MRNLSYLASGIFLLLCLLSLSMVLAGRAQQPPTDLFTGLAACDGLPCYQGIVPLKTAYSQGRSIVENLPGSSWSRQDSRRANLRSGAVEWVILFRSNEGVVRELSIRPRSGVVNIGNIVAQLDMPCAVYPVRPTYQFPSVVVLAYPTMMVWVEMYGRKLTPTQPVIEVNLVPPAAPGFVNPCENANWRTRYTWKGFRWYPF